MRDYHRHYRDYASKKSTDADKANHPWRVRLPTQLDQLRQILHIYALLAQLPPSVNRLMLLPHRDLHRVPLPALFGDRLTCTLLPSLQIGLNLRQRLQASSQPFAIAPLLNVDDPVTEQKPMPFAQLESALIRHLVPDSHHILPNAASLEQVCQNLQGSYRSWHFTGHGAYDTHHPQNSAIALTDGLLTAQQLSQMDLSTYRLICLAACETAVTGNDGIAVEYVGLATACLKAGAANVLSTLWPVDEIASTWLMIRFYQLLLAGNTPAIALHQAQQWLRSLTLAALIAWIRDLLNLPNLYGWRKELEVQITLLLEQQGTIKSSNPLYAHPFYWAAFTVTGIPSA
jgi:CHAT domain-containing protein